MGPSSALTVGLIDLAGFTALTEAHGDEDAAELATRFAALVRGCLDTGDRLVKTIGDAVLLTSPDPRAHLMLVGRVWEELDREPDFPVARAGIHHGGVVERDGDLFGTTVNVAARVAGQAFGGQVLGTRMVADQAQELGLEVIDLGAFALKNLAEQTSLFEIHVGPALAGGWIDPVCRMRVEREGAAGRLRFLGKDYWFCSLGCAATFAQAPDRYSRNEGR